MRSTPRDSDALKVFLAPITSYACISWRFGENHHSHEHFDDLDSLV